MPRVKHVGDDNETIPVVNTDGVSIRLKKGEEADVWLFPKEGQNLVVVSDLPVWSHNLGIAEIDFTKDISEEYESDVPAFTGAKVDISVDADEIFLQIQSGEVTVYRQHPDQDPELVEWAENLPMISLLDIQFTSTILRLEMV